MVMVHPVVVLHLGDELQKLRALPNGGAVVVARPLINDRLVSIGVCNVIVRSGVHSLQFKHQKPFNLGHRIAGRLACSLVKEKQCNSGQKVLEKRIISKENRWQTPSAVAPYGHSDIFCVGIPYPLFFNE